MGGKNETVKEEMKNKNKRKQKRKKHEEVKSNSKIIINRETGKKYVSVKEEKQNILQCYKDRKRGCR